MPAPAVQSSTAAAVIGLSQWFFTMNHSQSIFGCLIDMLENHPDEPIHCRSYCSQYQSQ